MTDRYQSLAHNPIGKFVVKNLGLPNPPYLERWSEGSRIVDGTVLTGAAPGSTLGSQLGSTLKASGITATDAETTSPKYKGLVFDATGIGSTRELESLQSFFTPVLRSLEGCGRIVVIGALPEQTESEGAAISQRALEGFVRSLAKEVGRGSSA